MVRSLAADFYDPKLYKKKMVKVKEIFFGAKNYPIKSILKLLFSMGIADAVVVSYRKSGRTWLRLMLAKVLAKQYNIPKIQLDTQFMTLFRKAPNVLFSHGGSTKINNKINFRKLFRSKKIIFLTRDPRDDIVSLYHDYLHRQGKNKPMTVSSFIRDPKMGVAIHVAYLNRWAKELNQRKFSQKRDHMVITYENMHKNTKYELIRTLNFLKIPFTQEIIEQATTSSTFRNMRKMEVTNEFNDPRMQAKDVSNVNTYKTRKGKVGSYAEELSNMDIEFLDKYIRDNLSSLFSFYY